MKPPKNSSKRYWTPARVAYLADLWRKGVAADVIGERLDPPRSGGAVHQQAYRLGLPSRRYRHKHMKTELRVKMDREEYDAIGRRALVRGMNRSAYIRHLVQLDIVRDHAA